MGRDLNFDLDRLLRAPTSVPTALLVRRLVDADLEPASAFGRDPLCSYQGPEGTRPWRIDGLLVDTRLAALLHTAERLPRGAIPGHTPVRFDLHLKGASQRVVKCVRPKPIELVPREEHERLILVNRLLDPVEAGWRVSLSMGDLDHSRAFWTTEAEETLLALACLDIAPDSLPARAALPPAPPHLPRGRGTQQLLGEVRVCPKQRRDTGGPLTCPLARIQAAQGPLWGVLRWLERPAHGVGATPRRVQQALAALRRRLDKLCALGPAYAGLEPGGTHDRRARRRCCAASIRTLRARCGPRCGQSTRAACKSGAPGWRRPGPPTKEWCTDGSRMSPTPRRSPSSLGRMAQPRPTWQKWMASYRTPSGQ